MLVAGCLNGGGQIRHDANVESAKEFLGRVQGIYDETEVEQPWSNSTVEKLYMEWLGGHESEKATKLLHTSYKEIEKPNNPLTIKW